MDEIDYQFHSLCPLGCLVLRQPKTLCHAFGTPRKEIVEIAPWLGLWHRLGSQGVFFVCGHVILGLRASWVSFSHPREIPIIDVILWKKKNPVFILPNQIEARGSSGHSFGLAITFAKPFFFCKSLLGTESSFAHVSILILFS